MTMVDVEGDGGRVRGDQSLEVNDEVARLRQWHGDPRRVIGYWNPTADPGLWPSRPEGLRLVIPRYNQRPGDLSEVPEPYRSEAIAHQHTSSGQCAPFGACDLNQSLVPLPELLDTLGIPTTKEAPVPAMTDNELNRRFDNIDAKLDQILAQHGPWPQTGNRTLLDAVAAIGQKQGVPGCRDVLAEPRQAA
ncbi:hypothetical protein [Segniliparus rotundus]|uniref:hypothetical protein n=1 Tax=Segniliparus rotundus TaxID=286802 RepID=UPI0002F8D557|nr:hypothetical protein [Segniliparus rotundus]